LNLPDDFLKQKLNHQPPPSFALSGMSWSNSPLTWRGKRGWGFELQISLGHNNNHLNLVQDQNKYGVAYKKSISSAA
jgi:hypothetical protein